MSGICLCRNENVSYRHDCDRPPVTLNGLSTTMPRSYESYVVDGDRIFDVFMPESRQYIGVSEEEFNSQFRIICQE